MMVRAEARRRKELTQPSVVELHQRMRGGTSYSSSRVPRALHGSHESAAVGAVAFGPTGPGPGGGTCGKRLTVAKGCATRSARLGHGGRIDERSGCRRKWPAAGLPLAGATENEASRGPALKVTNRWAAPDQVLL